MAGSSSDSAGPAAFAAVQQHNRPDTITKQAAEIKDQAAEIKDLKRKLQESSHALESAWDDRIEVVGERNHIIDDFMDHKRACYDLKHVMQDCNRQIRQELDKVAKERGYEHPQNWPSEARALEQLRNLFANGPGSMEETMEELAPSEDEEDAE